MSKLIFVKHSIPEMNSDLPHHEWQLSVEGKDQALKLANQLRSFKVNKFYSSEERSSIETTYLIASELLKRWEPVQGISHDCQVVTAMKYPKPIWKEKIKQFLTMKDHVILGNETASDVKTRIKLELEKLISNVGSNEDICVITSSITMALFIEDYSSNQASELWDGFLEPIIAVIDLDSRRMTKLSTVNALTR
ncbi:histidine phosphatase family protein [Paenalkalicoccus suaedae]|uniref:Histidine phosphatase family protein n=1 Tax=Paenalkalicoccus suaedae TaxID=2592382 RepID=A0A859FF72_9BACI|nr:histidine phosphatase family protein [Paenalkalicoccus suaedae]QKS71621.1 histidine phosphatase family protein [Paenalkalicoccus suaedae]